MRSGCAASPCQRLAATSLPRHVHLQGFQRNVRGYFALADVGFLPSRFSGESFPLVIIECLQAGRPFLATDLGEITYMLSGDEGPAGAVVGLRGEAVDIAALATEIARLATDADYFANLVAQVPAVVQKFDPAILAARHDAVYRDAVAGTGVGH